MSWYRQPSEVSDRNDHQHGWMTDLGDVQRYSYDPYQVRVYITTLPKREITIAMTLHHVWSGGIIYQDYWRFDLKEKSAAQTCFKKVCKAAEGVIEHFRIADSPNSLIVPHIREATRFIELDRKPSCRIPYIDWAREHAGVKDWRNSIYGNRYPATDGM
jgi:hypothetical protein